MPFIDMASTSASSLVCMVYISVTMVTITSGEIRMTPSTWDTPINTSVNWHISSVHENKSDDINIEMSDEKRLITILLSRYSKLGRLGRPVRNVSTTVSVTFGLGLIQMELDEKDKVLSMSMWTRYQWKDEYLVWDETEFHGIQTIRLNSDLIWIPDIMLYNTADVDIEARDALAVINSEGLVTWFPHSIFRSSCSVDVTNFPFDLQNCHMWFGSWTHNSHEIDLNMAFDHGIDLSTFQSDHKESSCWEVLNVTSKRMLMPSEDEEPNFAVLTFDLHLRRKAVFSTYILTLPCIFLACLTLVVFWLPPERPDRTGLAMSVFASFMVLLLILVEAAMPTASSVPLLGVYYCFNMIIIMIAIIQSCVSVNIARGNPNKAPPLWLLTCTYGLLARILFINCKHFNRKSQTGNAMSRDQDCDVTTELMHGENMETPKANYNFNHSDGVMTDSKNFSGLYNVVENQVTDIRKFLQRMENKMEENRVKADNASRLLNEWRMVAIVLDRFFFLIYIFLISISLGVLFPKPS